MSLPNQQRERCFQCSKIVYPQERLSIDSQIYHKNCLRCKTCATTLAIHNYVNVKGAIYCRRHVPVEGSGPKINVHGELQLSPRPPGQAPAETQPAASAAPHAAVPPLSPRVHQISPMHYVNPRLSPRSAHPTGSGLAQLSPRLPASAHPAPVVVVHSSSNHKVTVPEAFTHPNISHSASSEEEDAPAPVTQSLAKPSDGKDKDRPRTDKDRTDRSRKPAPRKERDRRSDDKRTDDKRRSPDHRSNLSSSSHDKDKRADSKSSNLGVSRAHAKKDPSRPSRSSQESKPITDSTLAEANPAFPAAAAVSSPPEVSPPPLASGSSPSQAPEAASVSAPAHAAAEPPAAAPAVSPLNIPPQSVHTPAPPVAPSPRSSHAMHFTSDYHATHSNGTAPAPAAAPAPVVHVTTEPLREAPHVVYTAPQEGGKKTSGRSGDKDKKDKKDKHEATAAPVSISAPLSLEELQRMREGGRMAAPATTVTQNPSPRHHETEVHKVGAEKAALLAFAKQPENTKCADCGASPAEWASANLGVFLCIACSGSHRALGTHISKVKSVLLDEWTQAEIDFFVARGNAQAAAVQHPVQLPPDVAMDKDTPQGQRNAVVRARYTGQAYVVPDDAKDHKAARKDTTKVVMAAGVLKINVIEGRNLPSKDLNGFSDPYVVILQQGQRAGKTNKIKKTLNPKWNETVMVNLPSLAEKLTVQVWDWDRIGSHNFMGEAPLNLLVYNITPNTSVKFWLPVFAKEKQQGEVSLELTYFPIG